MIGFLHPGSMGASLAEACRASTMWCARDRSETTRARAQAAGMSAASDIAELAEACDVIVSVCPPGAASDVARQVKMVGFEGLYVDVNAISPGTARDIATNFERFVDGGIVGPPVRAGATRLYLSGAEAESVATLWHDTDLEVRVVSGGPGAASAVKTCFASWTKTTSALLLAIRALARSEGVEDAIIGEWEMSMPDLLSRADGAAANSAPKAWRFVGEMNEHARSFADSGLPDGFLVAAAQVYERLSNLRDAPAVDLEAVIEQLNATV